MKYCIAPTITLLLVIASICAYLIYGNGAFLISSIYGLFCFSAVTIMVCAIQKIDAEIKRITASVKRMDRETIVVDRKAEPNVIEIRHSSPPYFACYKRNGDVFTEEE